LFVVLLITLYQLLKTGFLFFFGGGGERREWEKEREREREMRMATSNIKVGKRVHFERMTL
jgi:hypothetical protein